jgi:predicted nucleic acid-binding protein
VIYVDTNIIVDVVQPDPVWAEWSASALERARSSDQLVTGPIVAAEVAHGLETIELLEHTFAGLSIDLLDADLMAAFRAGQAFREYRRRGGQRASLLPDFLIGAQAAALGAAVLTRDPRRFRSYFPDLPLITPDRGALTSP